MVTEKDLRFAFHMDTGSYGFWDPDKWQEKTLWEGHPTSEYGRWLEEHAGNARWLQRAYQFENQKAPIYNSKGKSYYKRGFRRYYQYVIRSVYDADYCFWLEQRILNKKPEVVSNILHI